VQYLIVNAPRRSMSVTKYRAARVQKGRAGLMTPREKESGPVDRVRRVGRVGGVKGVETWRGRGRGRGRRGISGVYSKDHTA
jgi:hypothetical protein